MPQEQTHPGYTEDQLARMCTSKTRYTSPSKALHAAMRRLRSTRRRRYYKCPICEGWHLTSQPSKGAKV